MTTSLQTLSYLTANLAAGRNPQLEIAPLAYGSIPAEGGGGYPVTGAMLAYLRIALRENPFWRTCYYVITTADLGATYDVEINGTTVSYSGAPADLAALLAAIAAAINANGTLSAAGFSAAVSDRDGNGVNDSVRIVRTASAGALNDYAFDGSATGTAVIALYADAVGANVQVYDRPDVAPSTTLITAGTPAYRAAVGWCARPNEEGTMSRSVDGRGYCNQNVDVAGCAGLWPGLYDVVGHASDGGSVILTASILVYPKRQEST